MKKKQSYPKKEFKEPNIKRLSSSAHSSITINTDADDTRQKREISNSKKELEVIFQMIERKRGCQG